MQLIKEIVFNMVKASFPTSMQTNLDEANLLSVAAEALPATHESILPDQPMRVSTDPADRHKKITMRTILAKARNYM